VTDYLVDVFQRERRLLSAQLLQALQERRETTLPFGVVCSLDHEHAETPDTLALLRARRERNASKQASSAPSLKA
jgi:hypothetical protein